MPNRREENASVGAFHQIISGEGRRNPIRHYVEKRTWARSLLQTAAGFAVIAVSAVPHIACVGGNRHDLCTAMSAASCNR